MEVGIIGYGRMGSAIAKRLLKVGMAPKVHEVDEGRRAKAKSEGMKAAESLSELNDCGVIIIAVKPKDFAEVLEEARKCLDEGKLFISVAAGVGISFMESRLGGKAKIIRAMPNIAASIGESASVLVRNGNVKEEDLELAKRIFEKMGMVAIIEDERMMDVVTGISGSGPAYFFFIMKMMVEVCEELGLPRELARKLVAQTCKGAGALALSSGEDLQSLIDMVASPGGVTEEAMNSMVSSGLPEIFKKAVCSAVEKSKRLLHKPQYRHDSSERG